MQNDFFIGACSYGARPTFDGHADNEIPVLELHIIDFNGDLYDQNIEIFLLKKLRDQWKFDSAAALQQQIAKDVENTRIESKRHGMSPAEKDFLRNGVCHLTA
jgi:riboflavin kinase/FMN adenylyltransferase